VNRYGRWVLGLLFSAGWLFLIHFLAVDRCLDAGGGVAAGRLSCETSSDQVVSLFYYVSPFDVIVAALLAAIPVGFIVSVRYGRKGSA
jgi:hypothetical protein